MHWPVNLASPSTSESNISYSELSKKKLSLNAKDNPNNQNASYFSSAHNIFSKIYNTSRDQSKKISSSPLPSSNNSSEKISSASTSPNLTTKTVKNSSFSSADSFLLWWKSSHSSPNASRSPSPNPSSSSSGIPAVTPPPRQSTIRSRSLSPILPSHQRNKQHHRLSEGKSARSSSSVVNFNNFLRQYFTSMKQPSKCDVSHLKHKTIKRSKSASQDSICNIPIEIHHHLPAATHSKGLSFLDKQYSKKKKNSKFANINELEDEITSTTTTTKTIPLLLNGLQDGHFSVKGILDIVPRRYFKISIELRGFTVEVKFETEPEEKINRFFKSSFKTKALTPSVRRNSIMDDYDATTDRMAGQQQTIIKTTNYKLNLPIYADLSTLIFDWNSEMKTLNISGKVKGCSHFLDTPSSSENATNRAKLTANSSHNKTKLKRASKCQATVVKGKQDSSTPNSKTSERATSKTQKEFLSAFNCCNNNNNSNNENNQNNNNNNTSMNMMNKKNNKTSD
ncbi:hypothetical protein HELRODRAFT_171052 [Helobdella robusta]|uniref:Uncharacterized protein n=1 Tax=Helobdella robusta TaxID=6412 RepID=T1F3R4_HELRO|nr:hypothetical protein HELRODRAFT_171052 [Helobdella robusta]ESO07014.1 hypothetical protein HELRODRAFT_171052 [Helobdella robusta]